MLRFQVSAYGDVKDVNAYKSSGYELIDKEIIEAGKRGTYTPIYDKNGITSGFSLDINLELNIPPKNSEKVSVP